MRRKQLKSDNSKYISFFYSLIYLWIQFISVLQKIFLGSQKFCAWTIKHFQCRPRMRGLSQAKKKDRVEMFYYTVFFLFFWEPFLSFESEWNHLCQSFLCSDRSVNTKSRIWWKFWFGFGKWNVLRVAILTEIDDSGKGLIRFRCCNALNCSKTYCNCM